MTVPPIQLQGYSCLVKSNVSYPEQVWLAGVVQGWCPKYVAYLDFFVPNNDDRLQV